MGMSTDGMAITPYLNSWAYDREKAKKANGYIAFWKQKKVEVRADTSYEAQKLAAHYFRCKKSHEVTVRLAEKDGKQVTHSTAAL
jgi:hypothetical protein